MTGLASSPTGSATQVALVTGAGSGIGRATALALSREGAHVIVADIDGPGAEGTEAQIRDAGGTARAVVVDVTDEAAVEAQVDRIVDADGGIDVAVNCAGVLAGGSVQATSLEQWSRVMAVNVTGTFVVCRAVLPALRRRRGVIVNLASAAALAPRPELAAYAVSKAAVVMLTKSIALDFAADGVRANCVCPGVVDTPMMALGADPVALDAASRSHPVGRVASAAEVAGLIVYLVSPGCSFMTGAAVVFDGGLSLAASAV